MIGFLILNSMQIISMAVPKITLQFPMGRWPVALIILSRLKSNLTLQGSMESTLLKWEKLCRAILKLIWLPSFKASTSIQNQPSSLKILPKTCFKTHYRPSAHKQFPTMKTDTSAYVRHRTPNKSISTIPCWSSMCSFITIAAWEFGWLKTFWICWRKNSFMRSRPRSGYPFQSISKC
jgi:hypothetical protein